MTKKVLFIVPHADDEVLGFGGIIAKLVDLKANITVTFLQAPNNTRAEKQLEASRQAKDILGYNHANYLYLSNDSLCNDPFNLIHTVEKHLADLNPDIIYTTSLGDNHQDHKSLYRAVSVACRPAGLIAVKTVYAGEVVSSFDQSFGCERNFFTPNVYEEITDSQLNRKIKALQVYKTEVRNFPHPRSIEQIKAKAMCRGAECNSRYAEAFMLLRDVR